MAITRIGQPSDTLHPNGFMYGALQENNCVLSNFGNASYFEIPDVNLNNLTFVIKFTLPSTATSTNSRPILHREFYDCIEYYTDGRLITFNWNAGTIVDLMASPTAGATYWIKSVHSSTTTTYYSSTDGTTWTQLTSFTDAKRANNSYPTFLGSSTANRGNYFTGSIDLKDCYIERNGNKIWEGVEYNECQMIGGDNFDGPWATYYSQLSSFTLAAGSTKTISLAGVLPNANYDYEVIFSVSGNTNLTSGNTLDLLVWSGSTAADTFNQRPLRIRTRWAHTQQGAGQVVLPILKTDQNVTIQSTSQSTSSTTSGDIIININNYRRLGKNGTGSNYISKANVQGSTQAFGGLVLDGQWNPNNVRYIATNLQPAVNTSIGIDISECFGDKGRNYLGIFNVEGRTGTSSGNSVIVRFGQSSSYGSQPVITRTATWASSEMVCGSNAFIPLRTQTIYTTNTGSAVGKIYILYRGGRRYGTNY